MYYTVNCNHCIPVSCSKCRFHKKYSYLCCKKLSWLNVRKTFQIDIKMHGNNIYKFHIITKIMLLHMQKKTAIGRTFSNFATVKSLGKRISPVHTMLLP